MPDHSGVVRRAVIARLKADATVAGIVGARVHGETPTNPTWPFIYYGPARTTTYGTSCGDGSEHPITLHAFAKGPGTASIENLNRAIVAALDGADLDLGGLTFHGIDWLDSQIMPDGDETSAYHGVVRFSAATLDPA